MRLAGQVHRLSRATLASRFGFGQLAYAQEGEDMLLARLFEDRFTRPGLYVDVGAHHPRRFSNTKLLHDRGWRGINVDASREAIALFDRDRPRDVNIWTGVGPTAGTATFYVFDESALNTFDAERARSLERDQAARIVETREVPVVTLAALLKEHVGAQNVDLLLLDVEGLELSILESNDWNAYRPAFVVVEQLDCRTVKAALQSRVNELLERERYELVAKTLNTLVFACRQ